MRERGGRTRSGDKEMRVLGRKKEVKSRKRRDSNCDGGEKQGGKSEEKKRRREGRQREKLQNRSLELLCPLS